MSNGATEPIRVLIVDDEPDICLLLRIQLSAVPGLEVVGTAAEGAAALALCRDLKPDAVVMDLLMPGMNGFQAIVTMQADFPDIGIVAYTATAGEFVRNEMARLSVPLALKSGNVAPLAEQVRRVARGRGMQPQHDGS